MGEAIKELFEKYGRPRYPEVRDLDSKIYRNEICFINLLNNYQREKFQEIRDDNFRLHIMLEEKAFEQGFYVAYRILKDMEKGLDRTYYDTFDGLYVD